MPRNDDRVFAELKRINTRLSRIERLAKEELREEHVLEEEAKQELADLAALEELEQEIREQVMPHPLTRITYRDVTKSIIGAFIGIVGHFAFFYGVKIAEQIGVFRASMLYVTSLVMLILFLYFSGFRRVQGPKTLQYMPWRVITIYVTAHVVILFVLFLFGYIGSHMTASDIYKNVAAVSILAVLGAATADLIGRDE